MPKRKMARIALRNIALQLTGVSRLLQHLGQHDLAIADQGHEDLASRIDAEVQPDSSRLSWLTHQAMVLSDEELTPFHYHLSG